MTPRSRVRTAPPARPCLRFFYPAAVRARMDAVLSRIERAEDATRHASALARVVVELTDAALKDGFLRPLERAGFGFVARRTAAVGVAGALRVLSPVMGGILAGAETPQLQDVARHMRELTDCGPGAAARGSRRPARQRRDGKG